MRKKRPPKPRDQRILPLALRQVSYQAGGTRLLADITLRLEEQGRTIILGPNGAGKSLLLRLCHGLLTPSQGVIEWCGGGKAAAGRRQAMVFQRPVLLQRSVAANIDLALKLRRRSRTARRFLVPEALEIAGLKDYARRPAQVLSGGEQQRLALARAWALKPQVLFLDEPTANLDPSATRHVETLIEAIDQADCKIIMTTHDLGQARRLADEVIFLYNGRLVERTDGQTFFTTPQQPETQAFINGDLLW